MNWAFRASSLLLSILLQVAEAADEIRVDFAFNEDVGSEVIIAPEELELRHSPVGRSNPGSLMVVNKDHAVRYLSLPCDDYCREGEGILLSMWVKLAGPATKEPRCSLSTKISTEGIKDSYVTLANIPLGEERWTLLSGWYYRATNAGKPLAFKVSVAPGVTLLLDDVVLLRSSIAQPADYRLPLQVKGAAVREGDADFVMRGVNLYGCSDEEKGDTHHETSSVTEEDYRDIAAQGFNCVRLGLWHKVFRVDGGWEWLKLHTRWARRHGLRLILDMHSPPGGYQSNGYKGRFWASPPMQRELIEFWVQAAAVFKDDPVVAAFDLMNEPKPPRDEDWLAFATRALEAVRKAGWQRPVIVESSMLVDGWAVDADVLDDPGVIYDTHFYTPWSFTYSGQSRYGQPCADYGQRVLNADFIAERLERDLLAFAAKHGVAVNIGEFGVSDKALPVGGLAWLADLLVLMRQRGVGGQYFCWCIYSDFALEPGWFRLSPARRRSDALKLLEPFGNRVSPDSKGTLGSPVAEQAE